MRHTPGPWHIAENEDNSFGRVTFRTICATSENGTPFQLCLNSNYENLEQAEERKANANLIAAAPDLLEACKQTWHYIHACKRPGDGDRDNPSYTINIVEKCLSAAIAKAQGGA